MSRQSFEMSRQRFYCILRDSPQSLSQQGFDCCDISSSICLDFFSLHSALPALAKSVAFLAIFSSFAINNTKHKFGEYSIILHQIEH